MNLEQEIEELKQRVSFLEQRLEPRQRTAGVSMSTPSAWLVIIIVVLAVIGMYQFLS